MVPVAVDPNVTMREVNTEPSVLASACRGVSTSSSNATGSIADVTSAVLKPKSKAIITTTGSSTSKGKAKATRKRPLASSTSGQPPAVEGSSDIGLGKRLDKLENMFEGLMGMMYQQEGEDLSGYAADYVNVEAEGDLQATADCTRDDIPEMAESCTTEPESGTPKLSLGFAARFSVPTDVGEPIDENLSNSVDFLLANKLEEKQLADIAQKFPRPENCELLRVPKVNPLLWDNLSTATKSVDLKLQRCQKPLIKGITGLALSYKGLKPNEEQENTLALLSNSMFELNMLRKELIKPNLNPRYTHLCKATVKPTEWLFGNDLPKAVKEMDEQQKAVGVIKTPHAKFTGQRFSNMKFLPSNSNQQRYRDAGWSRTTHRPFLGPPSFQSQRGNFRGRPFNLGPQRGGRYPGNAKQARRY